MSWYDVQMFLHFFAQEFGRMAYWPVQILAFPVLWMIYCRIKRPFLLVFLFSHIFSVLAKSALLLVSHAQAHCDFPTQMKLLPALWTFSHISSVLYTLTRTLAVLMCLVWLTRTRKKDTQQTHAAATSNSAPSAESEAADA